MVLTGLNFVAVTALVKHVGDDVPAAQGAFVRYFLGLVFLIPMIRPILAAHLTRRQMKLFVGRGVVHTVAVILWFFAMARIPIADVTAMNYLLCGLGADQSGQSGLAVSGRLFRHGRALFDDFGLCRGPFDRYATSDIPAIDLGRNLRRGCIQRTRGRLGGAGGRGDHGLCQFHHVA